MARLALIFAAAISLTGCQERAAPPSAAIDPVQAETVDRLGTLTKPQYDAWRDCALTTAGKYFSAEESATTIARAAMTACSSQERNLESALTLYTRSRTVPADVVSRVRNGFVDDLTQLIISRRQDIKLEKVYWDEWVTCVVDAAGGLAVRELSVKEAVERSYRICEMKEDAVRRQLANLTSDPAAVMERRKSHASGVLTKFMEDIRTGGSERAKRPDITI